MSASASACNRRNNSNSSTLVVFILICWTEPVGLEYIFYVRALVIFKMFLVRCYTNVDFVVIQYKKFLIRRENLNTSIICS